jgi:hypothetical protein
MEKIPHNEPIDEIREVRRRISAQFDHDPSRLVAHYMALQEEFAQRLIGPDRHRDDKDLTAACDASPIILP